MDVRLLLSSSDSAPVTCDVPFASIEILLRADVPAQVRVTDGLSALPHADRLGECIQVVEDEACEALRGVLPIGHRELRVQALIGTLSHSRAKFCWVSEDQSQLAWHTGHLALFERYCGVPLWVRIDNLKTGVASGAGPTAVLNRSYEVFARTCGFEIDPCRPATGSDKGKAERGVRTFRSAFGEVFRRGAGSLDELLWLVDEQAVRLMDRLICPVTGTTVAEAFRAEQHMLQPLPTMAEPFDVVVTRQVSRDCLISFEGRRYSVPFAWVGRHVDVWGTLRHVVIGGRRRRGRSTCAGHAGTAAHRPWAL